MAIHWIAVAKLPLLHIFRLSPILWPFNLYLPVARHLPRMWETMCTFSTFFAFRLRQILIVDQPGHDTRWERALRLFCQEFLPGHTRQRPDILDANSLQALVAVGVAL